MTQMSPKDTWSAQAYNSVASFVYSDAFASPVLTLLDAKPGEKIYDFGCGSGDLTVQIGKAVGESGVVVGVDASKSMIDQARKNGLVHAFVSDIQSLAIPETLPDSLRSGFDAVFSNAALHWCKRDPKGVIEGVKSVLKPGGRFVAEMGGFLNCIGVRIALHEALTRRGLNAKERDPWFFPSAEEYRNLLESAGFAVQEIALHPRLTPLSKGLYEWMRLFARESALEDLSDADAEDIMNDVVRMCEVECKDASGRWSLMYSRLRFSAILQ